MSVDDTSYRHTPGPRHVERLAGETVVYDLTSDHILRLAPDAAQVWDACAEGASDASLAERVGLTPERTEQAVAELVDAGLVEPVGTGLSRRQFATRVGLGVAGAALVTVLAAPTPAAAASPVNGGGGNNRPGA